MSGCICQSLSRRRFGLAALAATTLPSVCDAAMLGSSPTHLAGGCGDLDAAVEMAISEGAGGSQTKSAAVSLFTSSGDNRFDQALGVILADISRKFHVQPAFRFYDDVGGPNALATSQNLFSENQGTVLFGARLLQIGLSDPNGDLFIMSIAAHEFAHVVQNSSPYRDKLTRNQSTIKLLELHADILAGCYLASRDEPYTPAQLTFLGVAWERIGDVRYTNPGHHGSPAERVAAIEFGYRTMRDRKEFSVGDMCEVGKRFLGV